MGCGASSANIQKTVHCKFPDGKLVSVQISNSETQEAVSNALLSANGKPKDGCTLTVRDSNGVFMIPSGALPANKKESPYQINFSPSHSRSKSSRMRDAKAYPVLLKQTFITTRSKTDLAQQNCNSNGLKLSEQSLVSSVHKYYGLDKSEEVALPIYCKYMATPETMASLKTREFDPRNWNDDELVFLMHLMYGELKLVEKFSINPSVLYHFLTHVRDHYQGNPFHNFRHCFCVTQMMYHMIHHFNLGCYCSELEVLSLLTACVCHDMDHPGFTNSFLIHSRHPLAVQFNDKSPLENHHTSLAQGLFSDNDTNILLTLSDSEANTIRTTIRELIMATDMAQHNSIMEQFSSLAGNFSFDDDQQVKLLMKILIKCADLSNELRPNDIAGVWLDCLLAEYFKQGDVEKEQGLPVGPVMDRDTVRKGSSQTGFISVFMLPMFKLLTKVFPQASTMVDKLQQSLQFYTELSKKEEQAQTNTSEKESTKEETKEKKVTLPQDNKKHSTEVDHTRTNGTT
ncbi:high affinity cGMP-specific 3',5'-cyclic phosphodiesterase 9A-like [Dysidea avara]|uniref:high affinity cGMP-specific 3',5'-cyclic phosphodiesterase 9A-like n=1 Tax=Dysidea avara TaxID=196820 RepID=UPI0033342E95